jgi:hypothetical protein
MRYLYYEELSSSKVVQRAEQIGNKGSYEEHTKGWPKWVYKWKVINRTKGEQERKLSARLHKFRPERSSGETGMSEKIGAEQALTKNAVRGIPLWP